MQSLRKSRIERKYYSLGDSRNSPYEILYFFPSFASLASQDSRPFGNMD